MPVISSKPNTKLLWASEGNKAEPTSDKQLEGWEQEIPPSEIENWLQYKQDLAIKYLYQEGIPEWDNTFEYNTTSYVKYRGVIYKLKAGAEVPNRNKQPDTQTTSWEIAFEPFGASSDLREELRKIREVEGHLARYVSKSKPVMTGIATAPEFQATPTGGHTFQGAGADTGVFLNSNNEPEVKINNVTKATVRNNPSITSKDTTLVTTAMLDQFKLSLQNTMFPIGISIITQDSRNPATYLGFGSWQRDLEGKALVGVTTDVTSASPDWVKAVNRDFGSYVHQITSAELPAHNHASGEHKYVLRVTGQNTAASLGPTPNEPDLSGGGVAPLQSVGGNQPHNNVQPSQTKFIWTRLS